MAVLFFDNLILPAFLFSFSFTVSSHLPIVKIGRVAGQFSKPRSSSTEVINGKELPSYLGDNINGMKFDDSEVTKPTFVKDTSAKLILLKPLLEFLNRGLFTE